jgi:hypothetical protein
MITLYSNCAESINMLVKVPQTTVTTSGIQEDFELEVMAVPLLYSALLSEVWNLVAMTFDPCYGHLQLSVRTSSVATCSNPVPCVPPCWELQLH